MYSNASWYSPLSHLLKTCLENQGISVMFRARSAVRGVAERDRWFVIHVLVDSATDQIWLVMRSRVVLRWRAATDATIPAR